MTTHTLNAAIAAMARRGMEQMKQPNPEGNGVARNMVFKQRNAPSYGKELEFKEYMKFLGEWDEGLTGDDEPKWTEYKKKYKTVLLDSNKSVIAGPG